MRPALLLPVWLLAALAGATAAAATAPTDALDAIDATALQRVDVPPDPALFRDVAPGPYRASWDSLSQYSCPAWFRDAKFGIFMHWGIPSAVDENRPNGTGWYAHGMYAQHGRGVPDFCKGLYEFHVRRYGHPSKFGYKDLIPLWTAAHWDPDALVAFYKRIGARYVVPVAVHHDNFDCYDSTYHRWNSVRMGPHRDIVGEWKRACDKYGLRFGVSSHVDRAPLFLAPSWGSDFDGPLKGVPYDGSNPAYRDFYLKGVSKHDWQVEWYRRTKELVDKYQIDLLYFDGPLPFGPYGLEIAADFYNRNLRRHGGRNDAVLNVKRSPSDSAVVLDFERGQSDRLRAHPWQTDTTLVGGWFYHRAPLAIQPAVLVGNFADIISKNGNLLLNVALRPDGTLPEDQRAELEAFGRWLAVNGEAVYGSRPWRVYGEGPTKVGQGAFTEPDRPYTAQDIRFTTRANHLYAICLGLPKTAVRIHALGASAGRIRTVTLLGSDEPVTWRQQAQELTITPPRRMPCDYAITYRIDFEPPAAAGH